MLLPAAPSKCARCIDGWVPQLDEPPTSPLSSSLSITDTHSLVAKHGSMLWYRDCTLSVQRGTSITPRQLHLPMACTDSMAIAHESENCLLHQKDPADTCKGRICIGSL